MTEVWLTTEDVCSLTGEVKETVRRKCKSGKYVSAVEKSGKYRNYTVLLSSLDKKYQDKYFNKQNVAVEKFEQNSLDYASAPAWARKQADKYLELINLTEGMSKSQIKKFLQEWNIKNPDKHSSYTRLYEAKR